ncbi:hypothetical protein FRB95_008853 [Tulasnella sp. JGI-2019a]|nr:hypothetical protein FRB95_008853 [Tulasnella sp. JGI-2019a]
MQGVVGHSGNGNPSATFQSTAGMAPIRPSLSAAGNNNSMARSASIGGSGGGFLGKLKPWKPSLSVRLTPIISSPGGVWGTPNWKREEECTGGVKRTWR